MDIFFKDSHESYFNQFQLASDLNFDPAEVINENDENIHDAIQEKVSENVRSAQEFVGKNQQIPDISGIITSLQCVFCQNVTNSPVFIKYCLHFFCKECIEQQIRNYKKECPLCKKSMGTKRELRANKNLEAIIRLLRPQIERYQDYQEQLYKQIANHQREEMQEMAKLKNQKIGGSTSRDSSKKRGSQNVTGVVEDDVIRELEREEEMQMSIDEETEEQKRIKRKVERLRANAKQEQLIMNKLIKYGQDPVKAGQQQQQQSVQPILLSPEDSKYYTNYEHFKNKMRKDAAFQSGPFRICDKPPLLDLRIKILFDEDLRTMHFPKVKEFLFRASSDSPLEIAAKALAFKNEHPDLWRFYSFSIIKKKKQIDEETEEQQEIEITDLKKIFGLFKDSLEQEEIIFFYKINTSFESQFKFDNADVSMAEEEEEQINTQSQS